MALLLMGCPKSKKRKGCDSDNDCKGSRVCVDSECVAPEPTEVAPKPTAKPTAAPVPTVKAPTSATVVSTVHIGKGPNSITLANGSMWVAMGEERQVLRIDPTTGGVLAKIPAGRMPIRTGSLGSSVFVLATATANIFSIDASTNKSRVLAAWAGTTMVNDMITGNGMLLALARPSGGQTSVVRIDPNDGKKTESAPFTDYTNGLVITQGSIFVGAYNETFRLDPQTLAVTGKVPATKAAYVNSVFADDQAVYVRREEQLQRIDPRTLKQQSITVDGCKSNPPCALASDGRFLLIAKPTGVISYHDRETLELRGSVNLGKSIVPASLAVVDPNQLWLIDNFIFTDGTLMSIRVR